MTNLSGLRRTIRFQKALRMAERGATAAERDTAEATARRLMVGSLEPWTEHRKEKLN
jgi:hypothetical protein